MINIILIYVLYLISALVLAYYIDLFNKNEQLSKNDLKQLLFYYKELWDKFNSNQSLVLNLSVIGLSSLFGMIQIYIFDNFLLGSFIPIIAIYFATPYIEKSLGEKFNTEENSGSIISIISGNLNEILIGYGIGMSTIMIYQWGVLGDNSFFGLILYLVAITFVVIMTIIKKIGKIEYNY